MLDLPAGADWGQVASSAPQIADRQGAVEHIFDLIHRMATVAAHTGGEWGVQLWCGELEFG
jgi:hypothetical protein